MANFIRQSNQLMSRFLILGLCLFVFQSFAQLDSIQVYKQVDLEEILESDTSSNLTKYEAAQRLIRYDHHDTTRLDLYSRLGGYAKREFQYKQAFAYNDTALIIAKGMSLEDEKDVLFIRGSIHNHKGEKSEAIEIYLDLLRKYQESGDQEMMATMNHQVGTAFKRIKDFDNAIVYLRKAVELGRAQDDNNRVAHSLMTLGNCYKALKDIDAAQAAYDECLELGEEYGYDNILAGTYNNLGSLSRIKGDFTAAMQYYKRAVDANLKSGNKLWLSYNYNNMGTLYDQKEQFPLALSYYKKSLQMKQELGERYGIMDGYLSISMTYESLGDYSNALSYARKYNAIHDSIIQLENVSASKKLAAEFQAEQQQAEIEKLNAEDALNKAKIQSAEDQLWFFGIGGFLVVLLLLVVLISLLKGRKKNAELRMKNAQIDAKNSEITDGINYAKRFQTAVLASDNAMSDFFKDHSILYLPKDIVSGDFYMLERLPDRSAVFVVADCTGHGVPGAMVSLIGASNIKRVVNESNVNQPGLALSILNNELPKAFTSDQVTINDGMDLSMCHFTTNKDMLTFAGANRNCWVINHKDSLKNRGVKNARIIESNSNDQALLELKGTRGGIGRASQTMTFNSISIPLEPGDRVVLTTDGFADQFGGPHNKKFKSSQLKQLVLSFCGMSAINTTSGLKSAFDQWRHSEDQIDDICVAVLDF